MWLITPTVSYQKLNISCHVMLNLTLTLQHCIWRDNASKVKKYLYPVFSRYLTHIQLGSNSLNNAQHTFETKPELNHTPQTFAGKTGYSGKHVNFSNWIKHANQFNIIQLFKTSW